MKESRQPRHAGMTITWLAALVCCGIAALAWFGYRATDEWQRSSALLVERRSQQAADLLMLALTRDMRGVQTSVLMSEVENRRVFEPPFDINDLVAVAFARYPYPECFFGWQAGSAQPTILFSRTDRRPSWLPRSKQDDPYPVEITTNPAEAAVLRRRIDADVAAGRRYSIFEATLGGSPYQVVALISYRDVPREQLDSVFGFMVNLAWVRQEYFEGITDQVSQLGGTVGGIDYAVSDERNQRVVGNVPRRGSTFAATREFPLYFFDPTLTTIDHPSDLTPRIWTITANAGGDPTLASAARGSRRTLLVVAAAVITLGLGLLAAVRAARGGAALAAVRADFVSTVTHELKTPLSTIRSVGEMLVRGRVQTPDDVRKYARILVQEENRLSRLVNNLLAYARVTDVADVYSFQPQDPAELVAEAVLGFRRQLTDSEYELDVDIPGDLPPIRADRTAMVLALDNLIDNAIRYSPAPPRVSVSAVVAGDDVEFEVADRGVGIPAEELLQVQRRFVRGRGAKGSGSGLGLAIVGRIAEDHGGRLRIASEVGAGTKVTLAIPAVRG
jgi:two-component system phosphate regulon sensor histidine kinase PhoR